jgi:hypothetical protein
MMKRSQLALAGLGILVLCVGTGCLSSSAPVRRSGGTGGSVGSSGPSGGSGAPTGGAGQGGSGGTSATMATDAASSGPPPPAPADTAVALPGAEAGATPSSDASPADALPLVPCAQASVDRLTVWEAHGGSLRPAVGGNLLVKEGSRYVMKVDFLPGGEWHEIVVPLVNSLSRQVDLTRSAGFTITYSATAELWVQLRPLSHAHGGEQYTARLPPTGGMPKETFISFAPASWGMLLGPPPFPFSQALRDANFFNFVGPPEVANTLVVTGLRIDGHVPPCN